MVFQQNALMQLCNRAHHNLQIKLFTLRHFTACCCTPALNTRRGAWARPSRQRHDEPTSTSAAVLGSGTGTVTRCWEKAVTGTSITSSLCNLLVPVPCLGYVTYSVLGLHKQLLHNTGTLDKDFIHVIKQYYFKQPGNCLGLVFSLLTP